jgi:hypothetical protein
MSNIFDVFDNNAQTQAAAAQTAGINTGLQQLQGSYGQGQSALNTNYAAALAPYQQNYNAASAGQTAYGNALGVNGQAGSAAALQAFQNSNPGYQFQMQQGQNAVLANQAATGQLASGNTNLDLTNYGQGLANQSYNQYVQNLQPYLGAANSAASGVAGVDTGLGTQLNNSYMNQGNAQYGAATSVGNANANAALGNLTGSANLLGLGTGILGLGVAGTGSGTGATSGGATSGGTLGGNLFSSFLSDERAKADIEPVGELYDGQPVFRYRYHGDHRHQIGLIAQDVEKTNPDAVTDTGALKFVDYKRATDRAASYAERLMKFAA